LEIPRVNIPIMRSILALVSTASFLWFLYWISYDVLVWNKPLVKVNLVNYAGAILSVAFVFAGFQWKKLKDKVDAAEKKEINIEQTKIEKQVGTVKRNEVTFEEQVKIEKPRHVRKGVKRKNKSVDPTEASSKIDGCAYNLGYLHQIPKGEEIPGECMTCQRLLQCKYD
jgi:hypothetical protein